MTKPRNKSKVDKIEKEEQSSAVTALFVEGFKSISKPLRFDIGKLTILAGTNSSGKSSAMQPYLLLKQTIESAYDPGCLLIQGAHVKFSSSEQILSKNMEGLTPKKFSVGFEVSGRSFSTTYRLGNKGFEISECKIKTKSVNGTFRPRMSHEEIASILPDANDPKDQRFFVSTDRCFLRLGLLAKATEPTDFEFPFPLPWTVLLGWDPAQQLRGLIHLPGHRGNPERTYPVAAMGRFFPGTFESYTATVISNWKESDSEKLEQLCSDLKRLGLTWKITSKKINDTQVELQVGRLPLPVRGGSKDLVSLADVGFGVSQTVPVLVALRLARPGQIVYLEQPEIHLHPRAQHELASIIAEVAASGVQVVVETHSPLLLTGVQSAVAAGKINGEEVKLHWFRRIDGDTSVTSVSLDEMGAFGQWPEDFTDTLLSAEGNYLNLSAKRSRNKQ